MATLNYQDPETGDWLALARLVRGPEGPEGPPGPSEFTGLLGDLTDVTAPADTPAGLVLGTTAEGAWGPMTPASGGITQDHADTRYVNVSGDTILGSLVVSGTLNVGGAGGITTSKVLIADAPTVQTQATNKQYVDGRIWSGTQAAYDAITPKDASVLYVVVG